MAIFAYIGIPGSGKSYEVVSSVILEAFKKGRRIITNIEGITQQKLTDYCINQEKLSTEQLGSLITVADEDCQHPDFFPYKGAVSSFCQAGDLICLDEVWRIFPSEKIHKNHRSFIAEHRHFTNDSGDCCDLVVINQSISAIPRFIKDRVETTFVMRKMSMLGLNKRYRVDVFTGVKINKSSLVTQYHNKYNPEIFTLYKSFDGVNGRQNVIDDRQNVFKSGQFRMLVLFSLIMLVSGSYALYYLVNKAMDKDGKGAESDVQALPATAPSPQNLLDEQRQRRVAASKPPADCVQLISVTRSPNGNLYLIKKGQYYETKTILHLSHVCNAIQFKG